VVNWLQFTFAENIRLVVPSAAANQDPMENAHRFVPVADKIVHVEAVSATLIAVADVDRFGITTDHAICPCAALHRSVLITVCATDSVLFNTA